MPGSLPVFDTVVEQFIEWIAPRCALDIGCGSTQVGDMLARRAPGCEREAESAERVDLALIGPGIAQRAKSEGLDLLNALPYRAAWIIVLAPEFIVPGAARGIDAELPRSVWSERDFGWHDLWAWDNTRAMSLLVLRGYLPSAMSIDSLVERVNEGALPLLDFDGQTRVRPCRLRLVDHAREVGYRVR